MIRTGPTAVAALAACLSWGADAAERPPGELEFVRVLVPADRLPDVVPDGERLVPVPLADFERAFAAAADGLRPRPLATAARYRLALDDRGRLSGTLEFDLDETAAAAVGAMALGGVRAERAEFRTGSARGEAVLFGTVDGGIAVRTPAAGTYACAVAVDPRAASDYRLPLVASLTTRIDLDMPAGLEPVCDAGLVTPPGTGGRAWRIDLAGGDGLGLRVVATEAPQPRVRCWNRVAIRGRQVDLAVRIVPDGPWRSDAIQLRTSPGLEAVRASVSGLNAGVLAAPAGDPRCTVRLPPSAVGTTMAVDVFGVARAELDESAGLPAFAPPPDRWAGGGLVVTVDPAFVIAGLDLEDCVVASPAAGARWPVPEGSQAAQPQAATVFLEQQSSTARAAATITRRVPRLDTTRVTTLELSPGAVIGRAACCIRVASGEAFEIAGRVAPEWFIDSVEAIEWPEPGEAARDGEAAGVATAIDRGLDWRLVQAAGSGELRIGLAEAVTPSRPLGLRITGHRRGVPVEGEFTPAALDMVRLDGETTDSALVDYRVGPDTIIEIGGRPLGILPAGGLFAPLVEPGSSRGRIQGGDRGGPGPARLVRRRPPLEADVAVQVVARDTRLTESLLFTCSPQAGAVDSVVVTVSEPLGDAVEWSLVEPAGGTVYARRLEAAAGAADAASPVRERWVVEIRPAVEGTVAFRASRTQPFSGPTPVTLAWVDEASPAHGTVVVRGAGGIRPVVVTRRLAERPPPVQDDHSGTVVTELSYSAADLAGRDADGPPVTVVPPDDGEVRAWVWREATTACCHDSGWIECDTDFDIENRGRVDVALGIPAGLRLDEVTIDGEPVTSEGGGESGAAVRVLLPAGRSRVRLHVRGVAFRDPSWGGWRIDPIACSIDAPRLARTLRLMVPSGLELVGSIGRSAANAGWVERLLDADVARPATLGPEPGSAAGFRVVDLPPRSPVGIYAVRRRVVAAAEILAAVVAAAACWAASRRRAIAVTVVVGLALTALWAPPPFAAVARAACWAGLAAVWVASSTPLWSRRLAAVGCLLVMPAAAGAADPAPSEAPDRAACRVYVTPTDGGSTALVPERLFRRLASAASGRESVRVRECRLVTAADGPWRLELGVDADQGGVLALDQTGADVRWRSSAPPPPGVAVEVAPDGGVARLICAAAGVHRVVIGLSPRPVAVGGLEQVVVRLPAAAMAVVVQTPGPGAGDSPASRWQCGRDDDDGAWRPGDETAEGIDVSRAARVRLVRSNDPREPVVAIPAAAESLNEVRWDEDACHVTASFAIEPGRGMLRSVVVRADRGLQPTAAADGPPPVPLGDGRFLLDLPAPAAGPIRLEVRFAAPLDDPTGSFDVPGVWLDAVDADARTVGLTAAAGLEVTPELPAGHSLLRSRDGDGPEATVAWRSELPGSAVGAPIDVGVDRPRPRVAVRRRPAPPRSVQRLDVGFAANETSLALDCQIDARGGPLTSVVVELPATAAVDRLDLVDETDAAVPVDVHRSMPAPGLLVVVVQRPRPGAYRLTVDAHLDGRPADGRMPLVRCPAMDGPPLAVRWRASDGTRISVAAPGDAGTTAAEDRVEIAPGDDGPPIVFEPEPERVAAVEEPAVAGRDASPGAAAGVEGTTVRVSIDQRGRIRGLARFEFVSASQTVRLRFPSGLRLVDLLVDGRETRAVAVDESAWDVRLLDVRWPRSILAVFAGDAPSATDAAIRIDPPRIEGLQSREVLWSIDVPVDLELRVAKPARAATSGEWRSAGDAVRGRLAAAFAAAGAGMQEPDRVRLREFAEARGRDEPLQPEEAWQLAVDGPADVQRQRIHLVQPAGEAVTIRLARRVVPATAGRGLATVALVLVLAVVRLASVPRFAGWARGLEWLAPWLLPLAGAAWVALLRPTLPGWTLVAVGLAALAVARRDGPVSGPATGSGS